MFGLVISMQLMLDQVASLWLWKKNLLTVTACLELIRKQEHNLVHKSHLFMCYKAKLL